MKAILFPALVFSLISSSCTTQGPDNQASPFSFLTEHRSDLSTEEGRKERDERMERRKREQQRNIRQFSRATRAF